MWRKGAGDEVKEVKGGARTQAMMSRKGSTSGYVVVVKVGGEGAKHTSGFVVATAAASVGTMGGVKLYQRGTSLLVALL